MSIHLNSSKERWLLISFVNFIIGPITSWEKTISKLIIFVFFFACISCEFSIAPGKKKTEPISIKDVWFITRFNTSISLTSFKIFTAFAVSITFREQKNGHKFDRTNQEYTSDLILNPVIVVVQLVWNFQKHPLTTNDTLLCTIYQHSKIY